MPTWLQRTITALYAATIGITLADPLGPHLAGLVGVAIAFSAGYFAGRGPKEP